MSLYHYTCDHGRQALGDQGDVLSRFDQARHRGSRLPMDQLALHSWFTDLDRPLEQPLGLTSQILDCDRTAHRYEVTDPADVHRYIDIRRTLGHPLCAALESAPGAMPMHWYVAVSPVPVAYSPLIPLGARKS